MSPRVFLSLLKAHTKQQIRDISIELCLLPNERKRETETEREETAASLRNNLVIQVNMIYIFIKVKKNYFMSHAWLDFRKI